jgi:hypothetical protein
MTISSRNELIAAWRRGLTEAQELAVRGPGTSWLAATRVRLYRFLLSLYGDGQWNADSPLPPGVPAAGEARGTFESSERLARDVVAPSPIARIQSVLRSVEEANEKVPSGPLKTGLAESCWVPVTAGNQMLYLVHCGRALTWYGIDNRLIWRGREQVLEVRASDRQSAALIVDRLRAIALASSTNRRRRPIASAGDTACRGLILLGLLMGPCVGALCAHQFRAGLAANVNAPQEITYLVILVAVWFAVTVFAAIPLLARRLTGSRAAKIEPQQH